jgi:hypothetical protein
MRNVLSLLLIWVLFVSTFLVSAPSAVHADEADSSTQQTQLSPLYDANHAPIHQWIAVNAWWKLAYSPLKIEMASYLPTSVSNSLYSGSVQEGSVQIPSSWHNSTDAYADASTALIEGTWEEDNGPTIIPLGRTARHFWDPDGAYNSGLCLPELADCYPSALEAAQNTFNQAISWYKFDKAASYYWLGRTAHLLMDMAIPAHVQLDAHYLPWDNDSYEGFTASLESHYKHIDASSPLTDVQDFQNPPGNDYPRYAPSHYDSRLTNLLYSLANVTDGFDSDDDNGDSPSNGSGKYRHGNNILAWNKTFTNAYKVAPPFGTQQRLLNSPGDYSVVSCDWSHDRNIIYSQAYRAELSGTLFGTKVNYQDGSSEIFWNWEIIDDNVPWAVCGSLYQPELESRAIGYTAALYELFWDRTHTVKDLYEENDDCAHAYDLTSYWDTWLSRVNGLGIHEDHDWYKINVPAGTQCLYIECRFKNSEGDIDVDLHDASCNFITSSNSDTANIERICYQNPTPGVYLIKVYQIPYNANTYDLWWGSNCTQQVTLDSPLEGTRFQDCDPDIVVKWNLSDKLRRYEVEIDDDPNFASACYLVWSTTSRDSARVCAECGNLSSGTYYWHVRGSTTKCNLWGDWSDTWTFKIGCPSLAIGNPISPADGITGPLTVTFDWPALISGPSGYTVQFDTVSPDFTHIWRTISVSESHITLEIPPGDIYWHVKAMGDGGCSDGPWKGPYAYTDVDDTVSATLPLKFVLSQNFPNPFNPVTEVEYSVPYRAYVTIDIYNILGERVKRLVSETKSAGSYKIEWSGADEAGKSVSTGVYLYRFQAGDVVQTKKMLLLK